MLLGLISDTHDNLWSLEKAARYLERADVIVHCGDLCSPFMVPRLAGIAPGKMVHVVWGNNDGDRRMITHLANENPNVILHGEILQLDLEGVKIAANHYPEIGEALAHSGQYQLVCYGHTHRTDERRIGNTLLLNPGDLMGLYRRQTMVLVELPSLQLTWVDLAASE